MGRAFLIKAADLSSQFAGGLATLDGWTSACDVTGSKAQYRAYWRATRKPFKLI